MMDIQENIKIKNKNKVVQGIKKNAPGILLAAPPLIGFLLFGLIPLVMALIMAFHKVYGFSMEGMTFVGFQNFTDTFADSQFWLALRNTFITALSMPVSLMLALLMAFLLNKKMKGAKVFRAIYFIPYIASVVAVTYMWQWIFNTQYGVLNQWLGRTGENAIDWLGTERNYLISIMIMNVWSGAAYGIVLYSASLTNVSRTLMEQAEIDGANAFQKFRNITLPTISPTTFYLFTMGLIGSLQAFAVSNILGNNTTGPDDAGLTVVYYIYNRIFTYVNEVGRASAALLLLSLVIALITLINFIASKYWVNYD